MEGKKGYDAKGNWLHSYIFKIHLYENHHPRFECKCKPQYTLKSRLS